MREVVENAISLGIMHFAKLQLDSELHHPYVHCCMFFQGSFHKYGCVGGRLVVVGRRMFSRIDLPIVDFFCLGEFLSCLCFRLCSGEKILERRMVVLEKRDPDMISTRCE